MLIAGLAPRLIDERMARDAAPADDHAGMLDRVVLIVQSRADDPDIRSLGKSEHLADDVVADKFRVVIEQEKILTGRIARAEIVDRGEVEAAFVVNDLHPLILLLQSPVIIKCLLFGAVILNDQDLEIRIPYSPVDTRQALLQVIYMILVGDQNGNTRRRSPVPLCPVNARVLAGHRFCRPAETVIVRLDRSAPRVERVGLRLRICGSAALEESPVIEDLRDMDDLLRLFRASKDKIIILCSVELRIQKTDPVDQSSLYDQQVADIVDGRQEIRIIIRLQVRLHVLVADADLVLIAV